MDRGSAGRSAIFTPTGGSPADLSSTFAAGTRETPAQHTLSEAGTLALCGTWPFNLTLDADVTLRGAPFATSDVAHRAIGITAGRTVRSSSSTMAASSFA